MRCVSTNHLPTLCVPACLQADRLQRATTEVEQKERRLVTQCLEQFSEARGRLAELRIHEEQTSATNQQLRVSGWTSEVCME